MRQNLNYEIDDMKIQNGDKVGQADKNGIALSQLVQQTIDLILDRSFSYAPHEIRLILAHSMEVTRSRFPDSGEICVGGLLFLRFFCPAILTPQQFGLVDVNIVTPPNALRTLTLLTKALQNIANQINMVDNKKEQFMVRLQSVMSGNMSRVNDFLKRIATYEPHLQLTSAPTVIHHSSSMRANHNNIVPDHIKLKCLTLLTHFYQETFAKKLFKPERDDDKEIEIAFLRFAETLCLLDREQLETRIKELKSVAIVTSSPTTVTSTSAVAVACAEQTNTSAENSNTSTPTEAPVTETIAVAPVVVPVVVPVLRPSSLRNQSPRRNDSKSDDLIAQVLQQETLLKQQSLSAPLSSVTTTTTTPTTTTAPILIRTPPSPISQSLPSTPDKNYLQIGLTREVEEDQSSSSSSEPITPPESVSTTIMERMRTQKKIIRRPSMRPSDPNYQRNVHHHHHHHANSTTAVHNSSNNNIYRSSTAPPESSSPFSSSDSPPPSPTNSNESITPRRLNNVQIRRKIVRPPTPTASNLNRSMLSPNK
ncbi:hypothetical protein AKO1_003248 [Acrasis kona]|uniref:Ras-GAP domain-containing protein n=1 Tax=Acrasis kona TaxID=1008807 RepID=A0AAW2Z9X6_9EUKA